jgi:anti-sigma regulatory factor (Ser/Thr protein kinase)
VTRGANQQHATRVPPGPVPAWARDAAPARPGAPARPEPHGIRRPDIPPVIGHCVSTELASELISPSIARTLAGNALRTWGREDILEETLLVVSELTSNAVYAAIPVIGGRPAIIFTIYHKPPEILIYLWDNGPGKPEPAASGNDAEGGRGLALVDEFTRHNWEWWPTPHSAGKVVRATVTTPAPGPRG